MRNLKDFSSSGTSPTRRNDMIGICLKIYDMLGREVAVLVNENKEPGNYEVYCNGSSLTSGTYIYRLTAGSRIIDTKVMMLVK